MAAEAEGWSGFRVLSGSSSTQWGWQIMYPHNNKTYISLLSITLIHIIMFPWCILNGDFLYASSSTAGKEMSSRREEERNDRITRGLMKFPPNRQCINCNSLVPLYVCTNFWTFVCTTWTGIHIHIDVLTQNSLSYSPQNISLVDDIEKVVNGKAIVCFLK